MHSGSVTPETTILPYNSPAPNGLRRIGHSFILKLSGSHTGS
jgi:hypothetical protein